MPGSTSVGHPDISHLPAYTDTAKSSGAALLPLHCHHSLFLLLLINACITLTPLVLLWGMKLCAAAAHTERVPHIGKVKQMSAVL